MKQSFTVKDSSGRQRSISNGDEIGVTGEKGDMFIGIVLESGEWESKKLFTSDDRPRLVHVPKVCLELKKDFQK